MTHRKETDADGQPPQREPEQYERKSYRNHLRYEYPVLRLWEMDPQEKILRYTKISKKKLQELIRSRQND